MDTAVTLAIIVALVFVFHGEPDVWDKWHAKAMETSCTK
jgi:hypothetical protein